MPLLLRVATTPRAFITEQACMRARWRFFVRGAGRCAGRVAAVFSLRPSAAGWFVYSRLFKRGNSRRCYRTRFSFSCAARALCCHFCARFLLIFVPATLRFFSHPTATCMRVAFIQWFVPGSRIAIYFCCHSGYGLSLPT